MLIRAHDVTHHTLDIERSLGEGRVTVPSRRARPACGGAGWARRPCTNGPSTFLVYTPAATSPNVASCSTMATAHARAALGSITSCARAYTTACAANPQITATQEVDAPVAPVPDERDTGDHEATSSDKCHTPVS